MLKKIVATSIFLTLLAPVFVYAQNPIDPGNSDLLQNAGTAAGYQEQKNQVDETTLAQQVGGIVKTAMSFLGIIFTVLMVYGGFLWMTARGNEEQVTKAQKIIQGAIIGLIIAVAAYSLTNFVVNSIFEATVQSSS